MQSAGRAFRARDARIKVEDNKALLTLDLADAWDNEAGLKSWKREVILERCRKVRVRDRFALTSPSRITWNFITPRQIEIIRPGELYLHLAGARTIVLSFPAQMMVDVDSRELNDSKMKSAWQALNRIQFTSEGLLQEDFIEFQLRPFLDEGPNLRLNQ